MSEIESGGVLGITFEKVADFLNRDEGEFSSDKYLQVNRLHMQEFHPHLSDVIQSQPVTDPNEHRFFAIGALSTYDLIRFSDPTYWDNNPLTSEVVYAALMSFRERAVVDQDGDFKSKRGRIIANMDSFYETLSKDSPVFADWLEWNKQNMSTFEFNGFLFGALLTALPFFLTRQSQQLEAQLGL
jgi:hypothetical protein